MSTNLEYRAGERQKAQREKGRQRSRARDKKQRRHFFVGRTTWKFCSGGDKMRNASGHQCKVKMSGSEKKSERKKRVTKKFLEVSRCSRAKQRQRNVQKKVCCTSKVAFLLIIPIVVFHRSPALPSPLRITRFYIFCLDKLNIFESFAFNPGWIYILLLGIKWRFMWGRFL